MGGTSVKFGIVRGQEVLEYGERIPTGDLSGPDAMVKELAKRLAPLKKKYDPVCIGMGVPGFVDFQKGYIHELTNVPGWTEVRLKEKLEKALGLPAAAENDANVVAVAEHRFGAGKGSTNMVAVTLGTGVGGGLILNGELFRGTFFGAGEIGQMGIHYAGVKGNHGNIGPLEKYVGNNQFAAHARKLYAAAGVKKTAKACAPAGLAAAAATGDKIALKAWDDFTTWLCAGLCSCVWLLNPDRIVIGGGLAGAGDLVFAPLRKKMQKQLAESFWHGLDIVPAQFENDAGLIGAAVVALEAMPKAAKAKNPQKAKAPKKSS